MIIPDVVKNKWNYQPSSVESLEVELQITKEELRIAKEELQKMKVRMDKMQIFLNNVHNQTMNLASRF